MACAESVRGDCRISDDPNPPGPGPLLVFVGTRSSFYCPGGIRNRGVRHRNACQRVPLASSRRRRLEPNPVVNPTPAKAFGGLLTERLSCFLGEVARFVINVQVLAYDFGDQWLAITRTRHPP